MATDFLQFLKLTAAVHAYFTFCSNSNTGSTSTGTSDAAFNAVFSSSGICPYFLNQFSARWRSPVASISSSSFASAAIAPGIFA